MAQISFERHKKFFDKMEADNPYWYNILAGHSRAQMYGSKNSDAKNTPLQFAKGSRPQFYYSSKQIIG